MAGKITFTMIKPDAVADGHIGAILGNISEAGFKIKAMKLTQLTVADAKKFYEVHNKKLDKIDFITIFRCFYYQIFFGLPKKE